MIYKRGFFAIQIFLILLPKTATFMKTIPRIFSTIAVLALALPQVMQGQMSAGNEVLDALGRAGGAYLYSTDNRKAL